MEQIQNSFSNRMKERFEKISLFTIAKMLVTVLALVQLIFTNIQVAGLLLLENQICGFIMFASVIMGLVSLFQAVRSKLNNSSEIGMNLVFQGITIGALFALGSIYKDALVNQASLKTPEPVSDALTFTFVMAAGFLVVMVLFLIDYFIRGKNSNGQKREDD